MDIGENIRQARKNAGLTQKELGEKLGISAAAVGQFKKKGRQSKPPYSRKDRHGSGNQPSVSV